MGQFNSIAHNKPGIDSTIVPIVLRGVTKTRFLNPQEKKSSQLNLYTFFPRALE